MRRILIVLALLSLPALAAALSFVEVDAKCTALRIFRDANNSPHAVGECTTYDADGVEMYQIRVDIWNQLTAQQKSQIGAIADLTENYAKVKRGIPTPTPTVTP